MTRRPIGYAKPCAWCSAACGPGDDDTDARWVFPAGEGPFLPSPHRAPYCGECQDGDAQFCVAHPYEPVRDGQCETCAADAEDCGMSYEDFRTDNPKGNDGR